MDHSEQSIALGDAILTVFNVGDLQLDLAAEFGLPRHEWRESDRAVFEQPVPLPVQCVLIQTADTVILVDAGAYDLGAEPDLAIPGYVPPPSLPEQLAAAGVPPERIQHVVITHTHFDHFNGLTRRDAEGEWLPTYANAMVYLGREDWDANGMQRALASAESLEARTLGLLHGRGLLTLVDGPRRIAPGIDLVPTPGETPGHLSVRLESAGKVAYCLGDLYHHEVEVEMPQWHVQWADPSIMGKSRSVITDAALAEEALLIATHIRGFGRLLSTRDGLQWGAW